MQKDALNNVHISAEQILITPEELKIRFPLGINDENNISQARKTIADIVHGRDPRLLVVCGPCSIHDLDAALEYARQLKNLSEELSDRLYIVMRVYFEKPRTTVGWKGLINDPHMEALLMSKRACILRVICCCNWSVWGCLWRPKRWIRIVHNTLAICSAGQLSGHVLRNLKLTVKWLLAFQCRWVLKMAPTVASAPPLTPCVQRKCRTVSWASIRPVRFVCCKRKVTRTGM